MKKIVLGFLSLIMVFALVGCQDKTKAETIFDKEGTFDKSETLKDVKITGDKIILSNKVIDGDLLIETTDSFGELTLDAIDVKGKIVVKNPNSEYTLRMYDVTAPSINVEQGTSPLRLYASKKTNIPKLHANGNLIITEQALDSDGFSEVVIDEAPNSLLMLVGTGIQSLEIKNSDQYSVVLDQESMISNVIANSMISLKGKGTIDVLTANRDVTFENEPNTIIAKEGVLINNTDPNQTTTTTEKVTTNATTNSVVTTKKVTTIKTTAKPVVTTTPAITTAPITTTTQLNTKPVITGTPVTINVGDSFDPLKGVTIYDKEDGGYITITAYHIYSNNVNVNKVGTYEVVYFYTDKGGLTTTYTRSVKVEENNKMSMPKNFKYSFNKFGDLVLEWDSVDNVAYYEIYVNGRFYEEVSRLKTNFVIEAKDLSSGRTTTYGIRSFSNDKKIEKSDMATFELSAIKDEISIPRKATVSSSPVEMIYKLAPMGIPQTGVEARVTVYKDGSVYRNMTIASKITTNNTGNAYIPYDPNIGLKLNVVFEEAGEYEFIIRLESRSFQTDADSYFIDVTKSGNSSSGSASGTTRFIGAELSGDGNWSNGAELTFAINQSIDLQREEWDLVVEFEWFTDTGIEGIITRKNRQIVSDLKLGKNEDISIDIGPGTSGSNAITAALRDEFVRMVAYVYLYDSAGDEIAYVKSSTIRFKE